MKWIKGQTLFHGSRFNIIAFEYISKFRTKIASELFWVVIGQILTVIGGFATVKILTKYLNPSQYGEVALANTLVTLVGLVLFGPLAVACIRFWSICRERSELRLLFVVTRRLLLQLSLLVLGFGLFLFVILTRASLNYWLYLMVPTILLALLSGYNSVVRNLHLAARHRAIYAIFGGIKPWLYMCFAVMLMLLWEATSVNALWGSVVAMLLVLVIQTWLLLKRSFLSSKGLFSNKTKSELQEKLLAFAYPFMATGIVSWVQSASDRWVLQWVGNQDIVGYYAVLFQLGFYPVMMFGGMLTQFVYPILLDRVGDGQDWQRLRNGLHLLAWIMIGFALLSLVGVAIGVLWHGTLFQIATNEQFRSVSYLLPGMLLWSTLFSLCQMVGLVPMMVGNSKVLVAPKVGSALLALLLNVVLAWLYGIAGIIAAGGISSLVFGLWLTVVAYNTVQKVKTNS